MKLPSDEILTALFQHVSYAMTCAAVFVVGAIAYKNPGSPLTSEATVSGLVIMALGAFLALLNIAWSMRRLQGLVANPILSAAFALFQILFMGRLFYLAIVTRFI